MGRNPFIPTSQHQNTTTSLQHNNTSTAQQHFDSTTTLRQHNNINFTMYPYNYAYAEAFAFAAGYLNTKDFILSTVTGTSSMANRIINALENPTVTLKVFTHLLTFLEYLLYFF